MGDISVDDVKFTRATVREIDGQLVLDDPDAVALIKAVEKRNCEHTLEMNIERVGHFARRVHERLLTPSQVVIVIINVDDVHGGPIAESLMPGADWQAFRDKGQVPFANGLALRAGIEDALELFDAEAAKKLKDFKGQAVVVIDHGVADVFPAEETVG